MTISWERLSPRTVFVGSVLLRLVLLAWGRYQDKYTPLKYTDIDYVVFTDAARYVSQGQSPYERETYRYTPLLAWLLYPTTFQSLFDFGKWLFSAGDVLTGYMIYNILQQQPSINSLGKGYGPSQAAKFAAIWILNPMVANISTRGSSEGLLAVFIIAMLWAATSNHIVSAGVLLGLSVHLKIYPFIYGITLIWWLSGKEPGSSVIEKLFCRRVFTFVVSAGVTFLSLGFIMYSIYGWEFIEHTYAYHLIRVDHRHNFSIYNTLLHLRSAIPSQHNLRVESLAFLPQLLLSAIIIPLALARRNLASTMLAQTLAFVTFNKVCTSQYFLWYMVFLPLYLPSSNLLHRPRLAICALLAWIIGQAVWLHQAYQLEFLGLSTFVPGLWTSSILFFAINCWVLSLVVSDDDMSGSIDDRDPKVDVRKKQ